MATATQKLGLSGKARHARVRRNAVRAHHRDLIDDYFGEGDSVRPAPKVRVRRRGGLESSRIPGMGGGELMQMNLPLGEGDAQPDATTSKPRSSREVRGVVDATAHLRDGEGGAVRSRRERTTGARRSQSDRARRMRIEALRADKARTNPSGEFSTKRFVLGCAMGGLAATIVLGAMSVLF